MTGYRGRPLSLSSKEGLVKNIEQKTVTYSSVIEAVGQRAAEQYFGADWQLYAQCCLDDIDPEIFFEGDISDNSSNKKRKYAAKEAAKEVCAECIVRQECLTRALQTHEPNGVWGGMTTLERRRLTK